MMMVKNLGNSAGVMVSKLDEQTFTSEFEFHWVPPSFDFVSYQSKKLCKLLCTQAHINLCIDNTLKFICNYRPSETAYKNDISNKAISLECFNLENNFHIYQYCFHIY